MGAGGIGVDVSEWLTHVESPLSVDEWMAEWGVGAPDAARGGLVPRRPAASPRAGAPAPAQGDAHRQGPGQDDGLGAPGVVEGQGRSPSRRRQLRAHRRRRPAHHARSRSHRPAGPRGRHHRRVHRPGVRQRPRTGAHRAGRRACTSSAAPGSPRSSTRSAPSARPPSWPRRLRPTAPQHTASRQGRGSCLGDRRLLGGLGERWAWMRAAASPAPSSARTRSPRRYGASRASGDRATSSARWRRAVVRSLRAMGSAATPRSAMRRPQ